MAISEALLPICTIQPRVQPCRFVAFDDEGAGGTARRVGMHLEEAVFVLSKNKSKSVKYFLCAQPDIPCFARFHPWFEMVRVDLAYNTVDTVSGDQQIIAAQVSKILYFLLENQVNTHFFTTSLQNVEQVLPRDTGDDMTAATDDCFPVMHIDSIPDDKSVGDLLVASVIGSLK